MKVGILTFHHTTNYGATLQAYGLWETIRREGHEVEIIDYRPYKAIQHYRNKVVEPVKTYSRLGFLKNFCKYFYRSFQKFLKMRFFLVSRMKLSDKKILNEEALKKFFGLHSEYDVIVCGSDQVWCINSIRGFDPSYFLNFIEDGNKCKRISYAASFGSITTLGEHSELIGNLIRRFDAIAVRDSNSLRLIQEECGKTAVKVLDPTFLIDFNEVSDSTVRLKKKYLLLYLEKELKPEELDFIKSVATKKKLIIVSVGDPYKIVDKNLMSASPSEWLAYYKNASYVVTNLYHGTIFAIKFKKPFTTLARESKMNKTGDLLGDLGLNSRFLREITPTSVDEQLMEIEYDSVFKKLEFEITNSRNYLANALRESDTSSLLAKKTQETVESL